MIRGCRAAPLPPPRGGTHPPRVKTPPATGGGRAWGLTPPATPPPVNSDGISLCSRATSARNSSSRTTPPQCGMRNSECGIDVRTSIPHSAFRTPHSALTLQALRQIFGELVGRDANLLECVPVAHRHGAVLRGLTADGDAERRAGLVLAAIAATDRAAVVVEGVVVLPQ